MINLIIILLGISLNIQEKIEIQNSFPLSVEILTQEGKKINSSVLENDDKIVFIDFWHSGCSPCMQMFDAVRDNLDEWNINTNCKIIAVACQERDEKIIQLIESKKWPIEIYFDPDYILFKELCKYHDKNDMRYSFPTVFIFDKKWQLIEKLKGAKRKFKNGCLPQKDVKLSQDDFKIDLEYYYSLCEKWKNKK